MSILMSSVRFFYGMLNNNIRMSFFFPDDLFPNEKIVIFKNAKKKSVPIEARVKRKCEVRFLPFLLCLLVLCIYLNKCIMDCGQIDPIS